jgi:hypothetical protein
MIAITQTLTPLTIDEDCYDDQSVNEVNEVDYNQNFCMDELPDLVEDREIDIYSATTNTKIN